VANAPVVEKDHKIGKSIDGSAVYAREIQELVRFLRTDALDAAVVEGKSYVNLLNDGVVKKDLFETGLGVMLLEHYYPRCEKDLKERMQKFTAFRPYVNPEIPFLSLESMWRQFTPELFEHYKNFQALPIEEEGGLNREKIKMLAALYVDQYSFPPSSARRLLFYLQQQYRHVVGSDPYLQTGDLSLFYAKTLEDWFGEEFIEVLAHFIHHASVYAYEQGYRVSKEEAKVSLLKIARDNAKEMQSQQMIKQNDFDRYYARALQMLQMEEKSAVALWQKILLVRRLLNDVGHSVFLDKTLYEDFHQFASRSVHVDLYAMQPALELRSEKDLEKFQIYNRLISKGRVDPIGIPTAFASCEEVMKRSPELVQKRFFVEMVSVKRKEVEKSVPLRQLMNWQLERENFQKLEKIFTRLRGAEEREERYELLESIPTEERKELDRHSLRLMVEEHPGFIREALSSKSRVFKEISVPYSGSYTPLEGIGDVVKLRGRLEAEEEIELYSQDGEIFYNIRVVEAAAEPEVMTFEEAKERGVLEKLLAKETEEFVSLEIDAIKKGLIKAGISFAGKSDEEIRIFCVKHRFYNYLLQEKNRLEKGDEYVAPLKRTSDIKNLTKRIPLDHQFRIEKRNEEYLQKQKSSLLGAEVLQMEEGEWSSVALKERNSLYFFQVREKLVDEKAMYKGIQEGQQILANEAKRYLMTKLLGKIDATGIMTSAS
jgi:GcvH upstream region-like protein